MNINSQGVTVNNNEWNKILSTFLIPMFFFTIPFQEYGLPRAQTELSKERTSRTEDSSKKPHRTRYLLKFNPNIPEFIE